MPPTAPKPSPLKDRPAARLRRQFDRLRKAAPRFDATIRWLQARRARLVRVPLAALLIVGGLFSFLPFLGVWMLPLGLMLLAIDLPFLQAPVAALIVRARRRLDIWRRWWRARRH